MLCVPCIRAQGFLDWKVATTYEGLLQGLGVSTRPNAFGVGCCAALPCLTASAQDAFDITPCLMRYDEVFRILEPSFDAIDLRESRTKVKKAVKGVGKALRLFSKACLRCNLPQVATRLSDASEEALSFVQE